ncbi:serine/threonine protein phosphatase [Novosphingobium sp. FSY-8]|uniref:Serine/threonine protein phosphatase n=1 Tax=Novosphingobium ovatum TaxID=1908523 RepID=A0ABW9XE06_9SPHN|nr:metallophosphoesterase family protein [Novosphingobium ovatum]NBC36761.1 serine/threonine protein phosphatase [Novosphingobium ovatum]
MISVLRKLFGSSSSPSPAADRSGPALPMGTRAYAVGDIHGRLDLFTALIGAIEADDAARGPADTQVILLGDLIDRGPDSAGVLALAQEWQARRPVHILMGNHEEMLLHAPERMDVLRQFNQHGGKETILSFGVSEADYNKASWEELQVILAQAIPPATLDFIRGFGAMVQLGDYAFVHAGVRPGVPLPEQQVADMRWIREPFLSSPADHGAVVVHGHSISDQPELRANRIGIDTGAYNSGRLTALVLEGRQRWLLTAAMQEDGTIATLLQDVA